MHVNVPIPATFEFADGFLTRANEPVNTEPNSSDRNWVEMQS